MIPKIIHYCWFGGKPIPDWAEKCIASWKKYCPDYKIIKWDESNYDVTKNTYMRQAYEQKKWGFVPDYARLDIIYTYGGIYLDTDVEVIKSLDALIREKGFAGFESESFVALGLGFGAEKENPIIKEMMKQYENISFVSEDGKLNLLASPAYSTSVLLDNGFVMNGKLQRSEYFTIFPVEYFCPQNYETGELTVTPNTYSIHHYAATWHSIWDKIVLSIERCKDKDGIEYKIRRMISFPFRVINKVDKIGLANTITLMKRKLLSIS